MFIQNATSFSNVSTDREGRPSESGWPGIFASLRSRIATEGTEGTLLQSPLRDPSIISAALMDVLECLGELGINIAKRDIGRTVCNGRMIGRDRLRRMV